MSSVRGRALAKKMVEGWSLRDLCKENDDKGRRWGQNSEKRYDVIGV